jgi:thiamine-monophosphate kinase
LSGEFAFLQRLRKALPAAAPGQVWMGDDAAVLEDGLLLATDVVVEGVHFDLRWSAPEDAGWKALAVNCSDLAAMGGLPRAAVAAVVVPGDRPGVADALAAGLSEAAGAFGCPLVGGDTAVGPTLALSVAVVGQSPPTGAVLRSGARPGDTVLVTGTLGGPLAALRALRQGQAPVGEAAARLHRPRPRLEEGRAAAEAGATAMIDVSDGLAADLGHICEESGVGVCLQAEAVPLGPGAALADAVAGGDDYELCFTASDPDGVAAAFAAAGLAAPVAVGQITGDGRRVMALPGGTEEPLAGGGWEHPVP